MSGLVGGDDDEEEEEGGGEGGGEGGCKFLRSLGTVGSRHFRTVVIMDLKVVFLGVCLCAFAVTYSEAGIAKCCMSTKSDISRRVLANVQRWEIQHSSGACDIPALVLYLKQYPKPICAHPKLKRALMRILNRKKRSHHNV